MLTLQLFYIGVFTGAIIALSSLSMAETRTEATDPEEENWRNYQRQLQLEYETFRRIYHEESEAYQKKIKAIWRNSEVSSKYRWIEYSADYKKKVIVDFEKQIIRISRHYRVAEDQPSEEELLKSVLKKTEKMAFESDQLAQAVETRAKNRLSLIKTGTPTDKMFLIAAITGKQKINDEKIDKLVRALLKTRKIKKHEDIEGSILKTLEFNFEHIQPEKTLYEPIIEPDSEAQEKFKPTKKTLSGFFALQPVIGQELSEEQRKLPYAARAIAPLVAHQAQKLRISEPLIYATIEAESAFNPFARSPIPAFGLMQIVPETAGQDATSFLFGEAKILTPSYLYNSEKNIEIGTAYMHLLYYQYLKMINDPMSRLFCTIAAYNTGTKNVARAFDKKGNIYKAAKKINKLSQRQVYDKLIKKLPYKETQRYLKKVSRLISKYQV